VQIAGGSPTTPDLLSATVADGMTALLIILAMSLGLIVPKMLIDRVYDRRRQRFVQSNSLNKEPI